MQVWKPLNISTMGDFELYSTLVPPLDNATLDEAFYSIFSSYYDPMYEKPETHAEIRLKKLQAFVQSGRKAPRECWDLIRALPDDETQRRRYAATAHRAWDQLVVAMVERQCGRYLPPPTPGSMPRASLGATTAAPEPLSPHAPRPEPARPSGVDGLVMAGGAFLNAVTRTAVQSAFGLPVHVVAQPGDAGLAVGAVWAVSPPAPTTPPRPQDLSFIGAPLQDLPGLRDFAARAGGVAVTEDTVAEWLLEGRLVAVVRGRQEWGPAHLCTGHRLVLAAPAAPRAREKLSQYVAAPPGGPCRR